MNLLSTAHIFNILFATIGRSRSATISSSVQSTSCGRGVYGNYRNGTGRGGEREGRIVGGVDCFEGEFPWMISFKREARNGEGDKFHFCGGFIISERFVLSAAHCFLTEKGGLAATEGVSATIGEFSLRSKEKISPDVPVPLEAIVIHPKYTTEARDYDIALIKLKENVHIHPNVQPICLPPRDEVDLMKGTTLTTAGWGKNSFDQNFYDWQEETDMLRKVDVSLWDTQECRNAYAKIQKFPTTSFICAGRKGAQSCVGDSGGPLMLLQDGRWTAVGIVSVGKECGASGKPAVYTYLGDYRSWIYNVIQD